MFVGAVYHNTCVLVLYTSIHVCIPVLHMYWYCIPVVHMCLRRGGDLTIQAQSWLYCIHITVAKQNASTLSLMNAETLRRVPNFLFGEDVR